MAYYDVEAAARRIGAAQERAMLGLYNAPATRDAFFDQVQSPSSSTGLGPFAQSFLPREVMVQSRDPYGMQALRDMQDLRNTADAKAQDFQIRKAAALNMAAQETKARSDAKKAQAAAPGTQAGTQAASGDGTVFAGGQALAPGVFPHADMIQGYIPDDLKNDAELMKIIAAGSKAESGWDVNRVQNGYKIGSGVGARGLFQFDMGGMGAPYKGNEQALLGAEGAKLQASKIVPLYADAYRQGLKMGLTGQDLASYTAGAAEKPYGWTSGAVNWGGTAKGYRDAYASLGETPARPAPANSGAPYQVNRTSQFGLGLNKVEAEAFCGPAAAIALAGFYGNNIPVEEVKRLAVQSGWNTSLGMAGPSSQVNLLHKMGVKAQSEGWNEGRAQQLINSGTPVIIDTPGHYFVADAYDPQRGYHVGTSGTDLTQGSDWLTPAQMSRIKIAGAPRTMIYA